jgi:electron-transferring-flavoprotein dehydrogenase
VLFGEKGEVVGVATGDMGVGRDGKPNTHFTRGMELRGKYVLIGEGARGSLAQQLILRYGLDVGREPQKFGVGLKEVWQIDPAKFFAGRVQHSFGWPLGSGASGGSFLYHYDDRLVAVGFVVHLNYSNPSLSPYEEFQRFKIHPLIRETFVGGKRLAYGARAISSGGLQSVPKLTFPGGALIGCAAGFVNFARIKGSHNAVLKISFDKASSVFLSNTNHEEDPPIHLKLRDPAVPIRDNLPRYGEPARLYCPAGVYEVVYADETTRADPRFVINAQNCVHCKTCDIKDPAHNIDWTPPEGGGGPNYPDM